MRISQAFPSRWLKAADLGGRKVPVVIASSAIENIGDDADKLVLYFQGKQKGLVLNVTNANMISEICGTDETDDWVGHEIVLFPTRVDFQGRRVDAIRVDYPINGSGAKPQPRQPAPPPPSFSNPPDDDDVPF